MSKTIAAISSAIGNSGISVIRISGDKAIEIADLIFKNINDIKLKDKKGYTASYGYIYDGDHKIDDCVATVFRNPNSYTGEDVVELSVHGGIISSKLTLRLLLAHGAVLAEPGEFTKRAFLNNKMDLIEAESVMDLISSKSILSHKAALDIKEGALSRKINDIKNGLVSLCGHLQAWADYPEEDIKEVEKSEIQKTLVESKNKMLHILNTYDTGKIIKNGISTVILGKPNVGKSTLMNYLSGFEKSIVTEIPGTTRDIVEETVVVGNTVLNLSDTAGIRESEDLVEKIGVEKALEKSKNAALVLSVFDCSNELSKEDEDILRNLDKNNTIIILNKIDLSRKLSKEKFNEFKFVCEVSLKNNIGLDSIKDMIDKISDVSNFDENSAIIYNERQRTKVDEAIKEIDDALNALNLNFTYDAITVSIEEAISHLLELTGERVNDTVVDNIFHNFCVGK